VTSQTSHKLKLLWLQSITCNGNTHSFLNHPNLTSILSHFELVYHPVLETAFDIEDVARGELECDILILEGSFREEGFSRGRVEVSKIVESYAKKAKHIISAGTCATFGGIFKEYDPENISGFCFNAEERTERYETYASKLISLPGCPIHPKWLSYVLLMLVNGKNIPIDEFHRPQELYGITVHTGCASGSLYQREL